MTKVIVDLNHILYMGLSKTPVSGKVIKVSGGSVEGEVANEVYQYLFQVLDRVDAQGKEVIGVYGGTDVVRAAGVKGYCEEWGIKLPRGYTSESTKIPREVVSGCLTIFMNLGLRWVVDGSKGVSEIVIGLADAYRKAGERVEIVTDKVDVLGVEGSGVDVWLFKRGNGYKKITKGNYEEELSGRSRYKGYLLPYKVHLYKHLLYGDGKWVPRVVESRDKRKWESFIKCVDRNFGWQDLQYEGCLGDILNGMEMSGYTDIEVKRVEKLGILMAVRDMDVLPSSSGYNRYQAKHLMRGYGLTW